MRLMSSLRFEALTIYCKNPAAPFLMRELAWFETGDENVLGALILDADGEFSGLVLARDLKERFRAVGLTAFRDSPERAVVDLRAKMSEIHADLDRARKQGDEVGRPSDFFKLVVSRERLHDNFRVLESDARYAPAREIIAEMMRWHDDVDGNFIEQFQTTGFDARIWELYLFAALVEMGLKVRQPSPAPDFICANANGEEFAMEATTINPTAGALAVGGLKEKPSTDDELDDYLRNYLPIKYAGPLTAKLSKKYWEKPPALGKPLVLAIQDFHDQMSMAYSRGGLTAYLYGRVAGTAEKIDHHVLGSKRIPSNFFALPGSENISAVLFNASATLSKFNRMGVAAGFGNGSVFLIRRGEEFDPNPEAVKALSYEHLVAPGYPETWVQGLEVYHNRTAKRPLDPSLLPGAVHSYQIESGEVRSDIPGWMPLNSITSVVDLDE